MIANHTVTEYKFNDQKELAYSRDLLRMRGHKAQLGVIQCHLTG